MSKIHIKTSRNCMICEDGLNGENGITFHKTRRQTHRLCLECTIQYLKPVLQQICNNLRKNIKINTKIKCPGSVHSKLSNHCKYEINIENIKIPDCEISLNIFRIIYILKTETAYLCPNKSCGQIIAIDKNIKKRMIQCLTCRSTWCCYCFTFPYHHGQSCLEYEIKNTDTKNGKYIQKMNKNGVLKFCPICKTPTIKSYGCNKMICYECGIKWCWLCETCINGYEHYNSNNNDRCSGKLWI